MFPRVLATGNPRSLRKEGPLEMPPVGFIVYVQGFPRLAVGLALASESDCLMDGAQLGCHGFFNPLCGVNMTFANSSLGVTSPFFPGILVSKNYQKPCGMAGV